MKTLRIRLRAALYGVFYRLPQPVRNRIVRLGVRTYVVGAVVVVRDSDTDGQRILLLRQPPNRGWGLPAGLLQSGEDPARGAVRELAEETGIQLSPADLSEASPNALVHKSWIDLVFTTTISAANTTVTVDGAEVLEAAWYDLAALPPLTKASARLLGRYGLGPHA